jgi:hypothetical protein
MLPTYEAFVVSEGSGPDRAQWFKVGALWPSKNGSGFLLVIQPGISISGRLVITERKERAAREVEA